MMGNISVTSIPGLLDMVTTISTIIVPGAVTGDVVIVISTIVIISVTIQIIGNESVLNLTHYSEMQHSPSLDRE